MWTQIKNARWTLNLAAVLGVALSSPGAAQQPLEDVLKESVVQATLKSLSEIGSLQLIPTIGDNASRNAREIGERLIDLAGKPVAIRIVGNTTIPTAVGNLEIVLPHRGMDKYTDSQVLFVIAHELAHIHLDHATARIKQATENCPKFDLNPSVYTKQLRECIQFNLGENKAPKDQFNVLRREQEHEADLWAARFLAHHGLPNDYKSALEKAHRHLPGEGDTHPSLASRLTYIERHLKMNK